MTAQEALARIRRDMEKAAADTPAVQKLIGKINSGTATLSDTELYAHWAAVQLGVALSDAVCQIDLSDRAAVCKALMLDQYEDINGFVDQVQRELDDRFGIRIAPQRAPFPEERVDQIAHSLQDASKPDDVIRRRARSTATVTRSFHDDRMRSEARFRSEAGIKCYIVREGTGCCPWCSEMVGRYEYGDEPDDVFRRHDNCTCSVTYECGRQRQDVWSKREWEAPEADAGAGEPVRLTAEQARELEAKHLPMVLTPRAKSGTMESREPIRISMQFFGQPNFSNQTTAGIRKSIRSLRKRISEHLRKIEDADSMYSEWGQLSSREQAGNIKHWRKEIERFKRQIEQAEEELRKRGEKV